MPDLATDIHTDSLLLRATFPQPRRLDAQERRALTLMAWAGQYQPAGFEDLRTVSKAALGLREIVRMAKRIPEPRFAPPAGISEEGRRFLEAQGVKRYSRLGYRVISLEMHSPLAVVLEIPPEAVIAFGFALLALAEGRHCGNTRK